MIKTPQVDRFTPSQLRELRSGMEGDFARLIRSMTNRQAVHAYPDDDAWNPEQSESDKLDAVLHERAQARLTQITAAFRRFDTGAYGVCARCGDRISFNRLMVMPEATLCMTCGGT
jgi:DnaK suppressor protein